MDIDKLIKGQCEVIEELQRSAKTYGEHSSNSLLRAIQGLRLLQSIKKNNE